MQSEDSNSRLKFIKFRKARTAYIRTPRSGVVILGFALVLCALALGQLRRGPPIFRRRHSEAPNSTLVVYIYRNTYPEAVNNLAFFLEHAILIDLKSVRDLA